MPRNGNPDDGSYDDGLYGEPTQYAGYGEPTQSADYSSGRAYSEYAENTGYSHPTGQTPYPDQPPPDPWYRKPAGLMALGALAVVIAGLSWWAKGEAVHEDRLVAMLALLIVVVLGQTGRNADACTAFRQLDKQFPEASQAIKDRAATVGTVWLGLTLRCCRCHHRK